MNIKGLKNLWKTVFGDPDTFIDSFFAVAFSADRCRYIEENDEVICALYWFDCSYDGGKLAYIYAVATHPDHRRKGLASRLLQETNSHLKAAGYAGSVLKPATGLFPYYERLGYVTCGSVSHIQAVSNVVPVQVNEVTAAEYGRLRPAFLPENGIIQDGITLDFLHTFAKFYASADALFCICRDEPIFFEYLGNPHTIPGILTALGIECAVIPTPGDEIPFAMWHPLNCTKMPGYLGISLE